MSVCIIMPTVPRRSASAAEVVRQLLPQAGTMIVHLNGHDTVPVWARDKRIRTISHPLGTGPTVRLSVVPDADHVLFVDDDLAYPPDYVARSVAALTRLGEGNVACYLAYDWPKGSRPVWQLRRRIMFSEQIEKDVRMAVMGVGTACFHRSDLRRIDRFAPSLFEYSNDIWTSAACAREAVRIFRVPTSENWITTLPASADADALYRVAMKDRHQKRNDAMAAAYAMGDWDLCPSESSMD